MLDKPILLLGRDPECDIQLESRKVSRRHCCIAQVGDVLVVRDLASTNGIRINGVRVVEGYLKPGDELTIGHHRYQIHWDEASHGRPAAGRAPPGDFTSRAVDDNLLEACDDPIPLDEPGAAALEEPKSKVKAPGPGAKQEGPHHPGNVPSASPSPPVYDVLPERIELAPPSDVFPSFPPKPPPSRSNG